METGLDPTPISFTAKTRALAAEILTEQNRTGYFLKNLIANQENKIKKLDRKLLSYLVYGSLQYKLLLDAIIKTKVPRTIKEEKLLWLLRGSVLQLYSSKQAHHALLDTSVEAAKNLGFKRQAGFINAVLRSLSQQLPKTDKWPIHIRESHPEWLVKRWKEHWDAQIVQNWLKANNSEKGHWLWVHPNLLENTANTEKKSGLSEKLHSLLVDNQISLGAESSQNSQTTFSSAHEHSPYHSPFHSPYPLPKHISPNFPYIYIQSIPEGIWETQEARANKIAIQNPIVHFLTPMLQLQEGMSVWDVCAAPGGKTRSLLTAPCPPGFLLSTDLRWGRLKMVQGTKKIVLDGQRPSIKKTFDRIWLDAPCSNSGALAGKPELRWSLKPESLKELAELQSKLLASCAPYLKPNGLLLFTLCSPDKEEGPQVVQNFLSNNAHFKLEPCSDILGDHWVEPGYCYTHPRPEGLEGFFIARLRCV